MISQMFRYGALLALFLIVLNAAQLSFQSQLFNNDIYMALIAVFFLVFGGWLALKLYRPIPKSEIELKIVNSAEFSKREAEVLLFLCHGFTNKEIAAKMLITTNTVKTHLKNIYGKLGVSNRTQAAAEAKMLNIVE